MPRMILVNRAYYASEDGGHVVDEELEEEFSCEPDEFEQAEGITAVDMAMEVLNLKIYAEEASTYPDWQRGTWYSRSEEVWDRDDADRLEISARLEISVILKLWRSSRGSRHAEKNLCWPC